MGTCLLSGGVQAPSDETAEQLFGYEQVAKRIANIRLTCKCRAESRISCADHKGYGTARMNWENRVKE